MSTTAKELAKILNLSEAAVSMALNHKPGVSTATRAKVIELAKSMNYDFSRIVHVNEETSIQGQICFIIYKKHGAIVNDNPFFSQIIESIEKTCRKMQYILHMNYLYANDNIEQQLISLDGFDGILLLATEMKKEDFQPFSKLKTPLIVLDTYYHSLNYDCVLINNFQGAYQATTFIIEQTKSQPGYLHSSYPIGNFQERADGFYKAIRDCGMSPTNSPVLSLTPSMDGAYHEMVELLEQGVLPCKCYFADNDQIAVGAMKALKEKGIRIPKDVSIIGFDDMPFCTYVEPSLTTINVPKQYMGKVAVERLIQIIEQPKSYPLKIEIPTYLVKRKSVE